MSKFKLLIFFIITLAINLNAKTIYVNGEKGFDDKPEFTGNSSDKPVKTISFGLTKVGFDDRLEVEGKGEKGTIVYHETAIISNKLSFLKFTGKNNPIIEATNDLSAGIVVEADAVTINGFVIKGFNNKKFDKYSIDGGVGVFIAPKLAKIKISECNISECNYGIYNLESQTCEFTNNIISKIESSSNQSGAGIMIWSNDGFLQQNIISNNNISDANFGIRFGTSKPQLDAEFSKIEKNTISNCEFALKLENLIGIFGVEFNTFKMNKTSVNLIGPCVDITMANNIFEGSKSSNEIETDENYPGDLLWIIWKDQNNKFFMPTYSKIEKGVFSIVAKNGKRIISNKIESEVNDDKFEIQKLDSSK